VLPPSPALLSPLLPLSKLSSLSPSPAVTLIITGTTATAVTTAPPLSRLTQSSAHEHMHNLFYLEEIDLLCAKNTYAETNQKFNEFERENYFLPRAAGKKTFSTDRFVEKQCRDCESAGVEKPEIARGSRQVVNCSGF
jgi:hypothetical protein